MVLSYLRETVINPGHHKHSFLSLLKLQVKLHDTLALSQFSADRKFRRDAQDVFARTWDAVLLVTTKIFDWRASPETPALETQYFIQAAEYMIDVIPRLKRYILDTEKRDAIIQNTLYYTIAPAFRTAKQKTLALTLLVSISSTSKLHAKQTLESLHDPKFFPIPASHYKLYTSLVSTCHDIPDILTRLSSPPLFPAQDYKHQILTRLAFTLLCCEDDSHIQHLPQIQEKLVETLRNPSLLSCTYQCLRVLLYKTPPHHLTNLWPIIVTDVIYQTAQFIKTRELDVFYESCRLLDLILLLQIKEFEWFVGFNAGLIGFL